MLPSLDGNENSQVPGVVPPENICVIPFGDMSPSLLRQWQKVRLSGAEVGLKAAEAAQRDHPFFSPRFADAVHQSRGDVLVAIAFSVPVNAAGANPFHSQTAALTRSDSLPPSESAIGFLPFHRIGRVGLPVGRFLNDAQNVIGLPKERVNWSHWMEACGLDAFDLHAIVNPDAGWIGRYGLHKVKALRADFAGDSLAFLRKLERDHRTIGKQGQKTRKLMREVGPLRLEIDCRCSSVLQQAIQWKRAQYQRTHILDLFLPDWTRRLIEVLHQQPPLANAVGEPRHSASADIAGDQSVVDGDSDEPIPLESDEPSPLDADACFAEESLRGILSVLWAGDQVVAAHIGMIERGQLHYWFPTYDPAFSRYSPGTALFTEIVRASTAHGIDGIDMGYGEQPYKLKQTATTSEVAFGIITESKWQRVKYSTKHQLVACLKSLPMKEPIKRVWRAINPTSGIQKLS